MNGGGKSMTSHSEPNGDIWVFGYGSLIWRPGFDYLARRQAVIHGYHRSFCIYSHVHRGTPERPGLVLGLDRGGSCRGVVYRVAAANADRVIAYLDGRERVTDVYHQAWVPARTDQGSVQALTYVPRYRTHPQYAGKLAPELMANMIAHGEGQSGPGWEYLENTVDHLAELGIRDKGLAELRRRVRAIRNVVVG